VKSTSGVKGGVGILRRRGIRSWERLGIEHRTAVDPVALFRHEWFVCGHNRKKKDKPVEDKYVPLTHVERWVPVAFAVLYIGLGAYALLVSSGGKGGTQQSQPASQHQVSAQHPATESQ
jgi:hypothetical protein